MSSYFPCVPACNYSYLIVFVVAMSAMAQKTADPNENTSTSLVKHTKVINQWNMLFWKSFPATHCSSSLN